MTIMIQLVNLMHPLVQVTMFMIFQNEEELITEDSIVWVKTNKSIWEVRVIKIPFGDLPEDSDYLN